MRRLDLAASTTLLLAAAVVVACSGATRHRVLTTLFDGVPEPVAPAVETPAEVPDARAIVKGVLRQHGPYASRNCTGCHVGRSSNALVAPADQLCARCHELPMDKRYVHGPIASGGCLVCHDPHSSPYRALLVADSATFCLRCHDRGALVPSAAHRDERSQCIDCHEPHQSDREFLLR